MADQHGSAVEFEEDYDSKVLFFIESEEPPDKCQSPSPEVASSESVDHKKPTSKSANTAGEVESVAKSRKQVTKSNSKSKLIRSNAVHHQEDAEVCEKDAEASTDVCHGLQTGTEEGTSVPKLSREAIMQLYEEREKSFTEEILNISSIMIEGSVRDRLRSRSKSPGSVVQPVSVGLDHLDNLVRLMEQLSHLKEENSSLKRKCLYLEDTKTLLQTRNELLRHDRYQRSSQGRGKGSMKAMHYLSTKSAPARESRLQCTSDSSDTPGHGEPMVKAGKLHLRSQSVGSIEVDNVDLDLSSSGDKYMRSKSAEKAPRDSGMRSDHSSFAKLSSKWERVKKVFSGKPETEVKSEKSAVTAEQLVRANSKPCQTGRVGKPQPLPSPCTTQDAAGDGTEDSSESRDGPPAGLGPPSPSSVQSEPAINITMDEDPGMFDENTILGMEGASPSSSMFMSEESCVTSHSRVEFMHQEKSQFLTVQHNMRRRQSSPTLSCSDETELEQLDVQPRLSRSSSYRGSSKGLESIEPEEPQRHVSRTSELRKFHRAAWGRVKDMIHVRKDSTKWRQKRSNSLGDALVDSHTGEMFHLEVDGYHSAEGCSRPESPGSMSRKSSGKSPRPSPPPPRRHQGSLKSMSVSPPPQSMLRKDSLFVNGSPVDVGALLGGVSEDFNKKMQEWEEKKRRAIFKAEGGGSAEEEAKFSKEFIRKMEEWEKMKGLASTSSPKHRGSIKMGGSFSEACSSPVPVPGSPAVVENLSESFSKTVQEWERIKTQRIRDPGSPTFNGRGRKDYRSKSRERDRSRSKYDKQRERDLQRLEKKEQKIEKERQKLEKLRQKLELESSSSTGTSTVDIQAEASSQDEAVRTPEIREGKNTAAADTLAHTAFSDSHHIRSHSAKDHKEVSSAAQRERERTNSEGILKGMRQGVASTPVTPADRQREPSYARASSVPALQRAPAVDDSTSIDLNLTASDSIASLEDRNRWLSERLSEKDEELCALQDEVQQLTMRINYMDQQHFSDIKRYKRELWASSSIGNFSVDMDSMETTVAELRRRLVQLQQQQQTLIQEKLQLQAMMQEEAVMRHEAEGRLIEVTTSPLPEQSDQETDEEVEDEQFQRLCSYLIKLHSQVGDLHLGVQERNQLLQEATRQLLLQEANNCLLQADASRRHLQVQMLRDARRNGIIKRWKSFSGKDRLLREERRKSLCESDLGHITSQNQSTLQSRILQEAIANLRHGRLDQEQLTSDILNALCQQRRRAAGNVPMSSEPTQTEDLRNLASAYAQTVMTLCSVPYSNPSSGRPSVVVPLETKSIQTSLTDLRIPADGIEARQHVPTERPLSACDVSQSNSKTPTMGTFAIQQVVDLNKEHVVIAVHRTSEKVGRQSPVRADCKYEVLPTKPCINLSKSKTSTTSTHTGSHSSPRKPGRAGMRPRSLEIRTDTLASRGSLCSPVGTSNPSPTGSKISPTQSKPACASAVPHPTGSRSADQAKVTGGNVSCGASPRMTRRSSTGGLIKSPKSPGHSPGSRFSPSQHLQEWDNSDDDLSSDGEGFGLQPHSSPVIRSRYPRKHKSSDSKNNEVFVDSRVWKATPPRRAIRHRRPSNEKSDHQPQKIRERTKSDSFPLLHKSNLTGTEGNKELRPLFKYERESQNPPVQDVINKFEEQSSNSSLNRPPPSPTIQRLSPVRRLKTAAELLQDSESKRSAYARSRASASVPRESSNSQQSSLPSASTSSSDKENEKEKKSYVKQMVRNLSRESTPDQPSRSGSSTPRCSPGQVEVAEKVRKLSASSVDSRPKPPLSDLTNESKSDGSSSSESNKQNSPCRVHSSERQSPPRGRVQEPRGRSHPQPLAGKVSKCTEIFEKKIEQAKEEESRSRSHSRSRSRSCSPARITQSDGSRGRTLSVKPDSTITLDSKFSPSTEDPWMARRPVKTRSQSASGVGYRSNNSSPIATGKDTQSGSKLFGKQPSAGPRKGGAVTLLCRQAISVDMAGSEVSDMKRNTLDSIRGTRSMEDSAERRRSRSKFLDSNWLQKPKKFFKVSNLEVIDMECY